jgi:molybdate transport system ATP-binding protein
MAPEAAEEAKLIGGITLDLKVPLQRFALELKWETDESSLGIFGHSGAGKTTVLEVLAGLRPRARGLIRVSGETWLDSSRGIDLPPEKRGAGYVPQDTLLFPHRDVLGNLLSGARRSDGPWRRKLDFEKVLEVLELNSLKRAGVAELSGGEKQRVALGRALCSGPSLLLLDEPLAGLDLPLRRRILPYLIRVREEFSVPTLFVSHDASEMRLLCREVMILERGKALARGRPEEVFFDASLHPVFREEVFENVLQGSVREIKEPGLLVELEPDLSVLIPRGGLAGATSVVFGLRAEDILLSLNQPVGLSAQNVISGIIRQIRQAAPESGEDVPVLVEVAFGRRDHRLVSSITSQARSRLELAVGKEVHLVFKAQSCRILAAR